MLTAMPGWRPSVGLFSPHCKEDALFSDLTICWSAISHPPFSCLPVQKPQAPGALVHVQVGVVQQGVQGGAFRVLSTAEVDEHLTALSERD